ncbi:MAG: TIGR02996 domain-containing protein [Myxococcaceae bacterium]
MSGDFTKRLAACTKAWRQTGDRRFATFADWATARALPEARPLVGAGGKKADVEAWAALEAKGDVLDFPRLVAAIPLSGKSALAVERIHVLAKRNDPRLITALVRMLEAPPWRANSAMPFFRATCEVLGACPDRQVRADLLDLASRYAGIVETTVGATIAALLKRTANGLDEVKPGPLPAAHQRLLEELESEFAPELQSQRRATSAKSSHAQSDDALLAAIYERPDDDGPRTVFADTLTERGDVRGEFISLQLARARGDVTAERIARERVLAGDLKQRARFCLPLSQGGDCLPWRGFAHDVKVHARSAKTVVGLPAWRTVEVVRDVGVVTQKVAHALLFHEHLRDLKEVHGLSADLIDSFPDGPLPWVGASFQGMPRVDQQRRFTGLKRAELFLSHGVEFDPATSLGGLGELEALTFGTDFRPPFDLLAALPKVTELSLHHTRGETAAGYLASATRLRRLELDGFCTPFDAPVLEQLTARHRREVSLRPTLERLPRLQRLSLTHVFRTEEQVLAAVLEVGRDVLSRLALVAAGPLHFERPFASEGVLVVRAWIWGEDQVATLARCFAMLPEGIAQRVVVRPESDDPLRPARAPDAGAREALVGATKLPLSFEFA